MMRTLAPGSRSVGFTLLELLVVMAIVAMASAGVGFALRDNAQVQLDRDAERLVALLETARARSRASGLPVRWQPTVAGFRFEGPPATEGDAPALPNAWLDADTVVVGSPLLVLGPDPIIGPQEVVLVSRSKPGRQVSLSTDGVRPFSLQPLRP
jgi:general secretion pathway protein H